MESSSEVVRTTKYNSRNRLQVDAVHPDVIRFSRDSVFEPIKRLFSGLLTV